MHRNHIIQQLRNYLNAYQDESARVERFLAFVEENDDCFERSLPIGHLTGSAWVVNQDGTHVLLTHHKKLGKWLQLGGHADGDSDVLRVAIREVVEESGIEAVEPVGAGIYDVDIHLIPARGDGLEHYHYDIRYALRVIGDEQYVVSDESHDLQWIEIAKLHKRTDERSMIRMAKKWRALACV